MTWKDDRYLICTMALVIVFALFWWCAPISNGSEIVTVTVTDFGKGMTPALAPFVNDPTRITYSQNFYSTQPGTRQLRFGVQGLMDVQGDDGATHDDTGATRLAMFAPATDSAVLVYTAGGVWYGVDMGVFRYFTGEGGYWTLVNNLSGAIAPYVSGDSITIDADTGDCGVKGYGTTWLRDLQEGDSVTIVSGDSTWRNRIKFLIADDSLELVDTIKDTGNITIAMSGFTPRRYYTTGGAAPYLFQYDEIMVTGTNADRPQYIFSERVPGYQKDSVYIRPIGIVDSLIIDSIYYDFSDTVRGSGQDTAWTTSTDTVIVWTRLQVVSRNKAWQPDYWATDVNNNPRTYYFRFGSSGGGDADQYKTYQIVGNSDTSLFLAINLIDTSLCSRCSLFQWPEYANDTLSPSDVDGAWGYIYSTTGNLEEVIGNDDTDSLAVINGGAFFLTVDSLLSSGHVDSLNYGSYWIQLMEGVTLGQHGDESFRVVTQGWMKPNEPSDPVLGTGESIIETMDRCVDLGEWGPGDFCIRTWTIKSTAALSPQRTLRENFFKISRAFYDGDTLVFHTDGPYRITDTVQSSADRQWVTNWRIVKATMPRFGGMAEYDNRLVAYGDSLAPGRINMSVQFEPFNWATLDDDGTVLEFYVTDAVADPVRRILSYDDRMLVLRSSSVMGYPDFNQLSQSDGLIAPLAAVALNNYAYWLAIDGVYRIERRDLQGYSVRKISAAIDPILNAWSAVAFGNAAVPTRINPQYAHTSVMVHNQRDQHLYLLFPAVSATTPSHVLTYDLQREQWDGLFDIAGNDAIWVSMEDTSRILITSGDSNFVHKLDYSYNDFDSVGINAILRGGVFYLTDQLGRPVVSTPMWVHFVGRATSAGLDSAWITLRPMDNTSAAEADVMIHDDFPATLTGDQGSRINHWIGGDAIATYWQWEINAQGSTGGNIFQPYMMVIGFKTLRGDN